MKNKYSSADWDKYYKTAEQTNIKPKKGFFSSYDIFLCDSILGKYLPYNNGHKKDFKICEIGSGDGKLLKKISGEFNYEPLGIEYAPESIKQAEKIGIRTIAGDVFDKDILNKYNEYFDVVYSYGFIEHIIPPEEAIDVHLKLLKKGGYLMIQVPRLKKFNYLRFKTFRPDLLPLHNLEVMDQEALRALCKRKNVQELFCKNYGTFKLRLPMSKKNIRWYILKALSSVEYVLNPLFRLLFRDRGCETKTFSPAVMFIGRKV